MHEPFNTTIQQVECTAVVKRGDRDTKRKTFDTTTVRRMRCSKQAWLLVLTSRIGFLLNAKEISAKQTCVLLNIQPLAYYSGETSTYVRITSNTWCEQDFYIRYVSIMGNRCALVASEARRTLKLLVMIKRCKTVEMSNVVSQQCRCGSGWQ